MFARVVLDLEVPPMASRNSWNDGIIEEFRASGGVVAGPFIGRNLLLLHTTGARTGLERVNPLAYTKDGDRYAIIASKGGADTHPDWYYNLLAHPDVSVEVGKDTFAVRASVTSEPERSRLYDKMVSEFPAFDGYRRKTRRVIPVIILTRP